MEKKYIGGGGKTELQRPETKSSFSLFASTCRANEHLCSTVPCAAVATAAADCSKQAHISTEFMPFYGLGCH